MMCPICRKPCLGIFTFCDTHQDVWRGSPEQVRAVAAINAFNIARRDSMVADFATRARAEGL